MVDKLHKMIRKKINELGIENTELVHFGSIAALPTSFGEFQIIGIYSYRDMKEHTVIIKGNPINQENIPLRIHSECLTGDAFTSLRCDCRQQLEHALNYIQNNNLGVLVYLRQEGRGIGLFNKLKAYTLQELGYDTYEANKLLGFQDDERSYLIAIDIIKALKLKSIKLLTNNPDKVSELCNSGVDVTERIPIIIEANEYNRKYLDTKFEQGHIKEKGTFYCQNDN
ncbi:GTP cyclohydrolase-2 [subsurface metagenome]